jgi:2-phospho-L-lactate guanylyltransferase
VKTVALVPFKSFSYAKKRLRTRFTDSEVEDLGRAMLRDVLSALGASRVLEAVRVLTDDEEVGRVAVSCGATVRVQKPDPGLNAAIEEANAEAQSEGFDSTLVVLGDLPLLRSADVDSVLDASREASVVIVPSGDGGTALLARRPPDCIPARFGPGSCDDHISVSRQRGLEPIVAEAIPETIRTDLDTPEDADRIRDAGFEGHTVALLRKLGRP